MKVTNIIAVVAVVVATAFAAFGFNPSSSHAPAYVPFYLAGAAENPFTGQCGITFYAYVKKGVTYQLEGSADCGQTYIDLLQFTPTADTTYSYTYQEGGYLPRLEVAY